MPPLEKVAAAEVDALNQKSVNDFVAHIVRQRGHLDISFNLIHLKDIQGIP